MSGSGTSRSFTDLFSRLGARRPGEPAAALETGVDDDSVCPTKALRKFLSCLTARESPVLLDLGPVVGSNVSFFGEQLGCKIFVEDLYADLERHIRRNALEELPAFLARRFPQADETVDGILCWDLLDYLDRPAAQALASELTRLLRPDGALLGFFGTAQPSETHYTKYVVVDETSLRHRPYPAARGRQGILLNREIIRMFEGLRVSDSFLLKTNLREILFRKPGDPASEPAGS
ncbi:MAG: class I SAM-dependent methyltransferase [Acidobacteriota bacterium]|nr:class I SAM-dependent methyltransferase [Acidobacteriota bacterium]